jgi:GntR family transcriptional repressor for pyruvate dehydrogenase complex
MAGRREFFMDAVFKPIQPKKLSAEIVDQIKAHISNGNLCPGEKIPSERDLAQIFGVSRPSVREAIMVLEALGFLESRQGGGTFVRSLVDTSVADPLSVILEKREPQMILALSETRIGLETWSAYLAAKRANDKDIQSLRQLFAVMEKQASHGGWDPEIDIKFHLTITAATHNVLQNHILETVQDLFRQTIMVALGEFYHKEDYLPILLEFHRDILEAIAAHDAEKARQAMLDHLTFVEDKLALFLKQN